MLTLFDTAFNLFLDKIAYKLKTSVNIRHSHQSLMTSCQTFVHHSNLYVIIYVTVGQTFWMFRNVQLCFSFQSCWTRKSIAVSVTWESIFHKAWTSCEAPASVDGLPEKKANARSEVFSSCWDDNISPICPVKLCLRVKTAVFGNSQTGEHRDRFHTSITGRSALKLLKNSL